MSERLGVRLVLLAAPGVALGAVGATHPARLTPDSAHHWWVMHVVGLFLFPLVSLALVALVWRRRDPLALVVWAGAVVFAYLYTSLDVIAGIVAGYVVDRAPAGPRPEAVGDVFAIGNTLGTYGEWGLVVAVVALSVDVVRRAGASAVPPAVLLLVGAAGIFWDHIYFPWGAAGALVLGLGTAAAGWAVSRLS